MKIKLLAAVAILITGCAIDSVQAADPDDIRRLLNTNSCPGCDLKFADLRGADLRGADLRGADLRGADLRDANLRGAELRDADLRDADLRGVRGANLMDAIY